MSKARIKTGLVAGLLLLGLGCAAKAQGYGSYSCFELWKERNGIYKQAGYCFKTARAQRYFGNAGCQYDNEAAVPLTSGDRYAIAEIVRVERAKGCSD
jgi:hypothetical protein